MIIYSRAAILIFVIIAIIIAYYGQNENSAWIRMTSPVTKDGASNSLLGYSMIANGNPIFKENISFFYQTLLFSGIPSGIPDMYYARPLYSFIASHFTFLVSGLTNAFILLNLICWAIAAWVSWHLTKKVFNSELASLISVLFVTGGSGFIFHIGDYSAHIMAFTFFYLGIYIIYESNVWRKSRPFKTHLILSLFLALASLQYNTGLVLVAGYVTVSLFHNKWIYVLIPASIAYFSQRLWVYILSGVYSLLYNQPYKYIDIYATEKIYLSKSLEVWQEILFRSPLEFVLTLLKKTGEFLQFDSPLVILLGIVSCFIFFSYIFKNFPFHFFIKFIFFAILAGVIFSLKAGARGYLVYGLSIFFYTFLAGVFAKFIRTRNYRLVAISLLIITMSSHYIWNTYHLFGNLLPLKTYFLSLTQNHSYFPMFFEKTKVLSLTGYEPVPTLFGGTSSLKEAGYGDTVSSFRQVIPDQIQSQGTTIYQINQRIFQNQILAKGYFLLIIVSLLLLLWKTKLKAGLIGFLLLSIISSFFSLITDPKMPIINNTDGAIRLLKENILTYNIKLSSKFIRSFKSSVEKTDNIEVCCFLRPQEYYNIDTFIGDRKITTQLRGLNGGYQLEFHDKISFLNALEDSAKITLKVEALKDNVYFRGWQRNGLEGRKLSLPYRSELLPVFEIRLRNKEGFLKVVGF